MAHHDHHDHHANHTQQHHHQPQRKGLHKDWRTWAVVVLMLAAMGMYVASLDESEGPDGEPMPAAANADAG